MSLEGIRLRVNAARSDQRRDAAIPLPTGVTECRNISYGPNGKYSLLDVYFPDGTTSPLPTIVSIHGGGYVYGSKENYRRYGMDMAKRGFAFVNFNYRLAPKWKFPKPLNDANAVMEWISHNAPYYHIDPHRLILVGDSAGAQLASHYAAIYANPEFAASFPIKVPDITIRAVGLNCGLYNPPEKLSQPRRGLTLDYYGRNISPDDPRCQVLSAIRENYPPAFITTACHDFLRENAEPMYRFLSEKGVPCQWKCYGSEENEAVGHVFHINILLPEAIACNDDAAAFFRQYL